MDRWFETKLKASEEEKHLEIGVAECGMTDEEWKKVLLAKLVWEYGLKLNSKLLMKINYFEIRAAKCGMTDVE